MRTKATARGKGRLSTYRDVRAIALELPGVVEGTSYGTPALKVGRKLFVRLKEDGVTLVLRVDWVERQLMLRSAPDTFFITDHYRNYPWVLVRLAEIKRAELATIVEDAWRRVAPKRTVEAHDAAV
jgi:hypothetical protein